MHRLILLLTLFVFCGTTTVHAIKGSQQFPSQLTIQEEALTLRGKSVMTYWGFTLYTIGLYTNSEAENATSVLYQIPKVLRLQYHFSISKEDIIKSAEENLKENPTVDYEKWQPQLQRMYDAFVDVKPSDVYEIFYTPGEGTKLIFNGIEQCLIEDDEFAKVFFGIWLSDHAISKKCKNRLLDW